MAFEVLRAQACDRDLALILDALVEGYRALGDTLAEAFARAAGRIRAIEAAMPGLGDPAFLGRPRPDLMPGLRQITTERAVFFFLVDAPAGVIRILLICLAGPDQRRQLLDRLGPGRLAPA